MEQKYLDKAIEILNKRGVIIESKNKRRIVLIGDNLSIFYSFDNLSILCYALYVAWEYQTSASHC